MKNVKVKVLFQTSRTLTQTEGLSIVGNCSRFGSAPGPRTYQVVWVLSAAEDGTVTEDDKTEAGVTALEKLDLMLENFDSITFSVLDVKATKGVS